VAGTVAGAGGVTTLSVYPRHVPTARVVCRFYDHPLVRELYPEQRWTWRHLAGGRKQTNGDAPEVLLLNGPSRVAVAPATGGGLFA
jgi:hypothetical protein